MHCQSSARDWHDPHEANLRTGQRRFGVHIDEIITNPAQYGIAETEKACAGRELFKEDPTPCAAPDTHFYYHRGHPSTAVNKIVGEKLHAEIGATAP